jgi:hypothetical protein
MLNVPGFGYSNDGSGFAEGSANRINNLGQIVGTYGDAGGTHGFLATPVP